MKGKRKKTEGIGFVVKAGRMTSLGSAGATFVTPGSPLWDEAQKYRSEQGIGRPYHEQSPQDKSDQPPREA